jgi:6-phosphogluconolactonase (cycloisomerase 2 family)
VTRSRTSSGLSRRALGLGLAAGIAAAFAPFAAAPALADDGGSRIGAVFVQLNSAAGNRIAAYTRAGNGRLAPAGTYATGGLGGVTVDSPLDSLASQGSLALDSDQHALVAVNAGSDSVTSFRVRGTRLARRSVLPSGGQFPVSIAVHGSLAYVLNAGGTGSISGYRLDDGRLTSLTRSTRGLGLANTNPPLFITAPAQVGFSADGHFLIVTTKLNNKLLTFAVGRDGRPAATPTVTVSHGPVPFSFVVDQRGTVQVTEAGTGAISSYAISSTGALRLLGTSAGDGGVALCWNIRIGRTIFGTNSGSGTLSAWRIRDRTTALTAALATTTGVGPIDLAASRDGRYLYVQESIAGTLGVYSVSDGGRLHRLQTVTGLPAFAAGGMEGIAAS